MKNNISIFVLVVTGISFSIPSLCNNTSESPVPDDLVRMRKFFELQEKVQLEKGYVSEVTKNWMSVMGKTSPAQQGALMAGFTQAVANSSPSAQQWCHECLGGASKLTEVLVERLGHLLQADNNKIELEIKKLAEDPEYLQIVSNLYVGCFLPLAAASEELDACFDPSDEIFGKKAVAVGHYVLRAASYYIQELDRQVREKTQN